MNYTLTEEAKEHYINVDSNSCPYCTGADIRLEEAYDDYNIISCENCAARWTEVLQIIDIEEIDPPTNDE
jgi:hypothetical protein